jgi:hypothetical protein
MTGRTRAANEASLVGGDERSLGAKCNPVRAEMHAPGAVRAIGGSGA